jgi:hypothetical protein
MPRHCFNIGDPATEHDGRSDLTVDRVRRDFEHGLHDVRCEAVLHKLLIPAARYVSYA